MIDVEASRSALAELRHARRHNHRDAVHWIDALYRVYTSALLAAGAVIAGSSVFGDTKLSAADAQAFAGKAAPWLGLAFAVAAGIGLRSGSRGGPLTIEAATVQYELLAPIDQGTALREPAVKQLRFMAFTGLCVGAVVAIIGVRQMPANEIQLVAGTAVAFAAAGLLAVSLAMIASGRRLGRILANVIAIALLAWSALDIALATTTSPFTLLASLATAAIKFTPLAVIPLVFVLITVPLAIASLGGMSIDDARRRAGLVSQLRFAVTLQDIRTVVLLRRQLAQETPRGRPWIRIKRGGRVPAIWKRDWRSYLRFPVVRIGRMIVLAIIAGAGLGATWNGVRPAFLISAVALYLAAYDAVEPLAQEVDHPSRWDDIPDDHGRTLLAHLPAAFVVMVAVCLITAATALLWVPSAVVFGLWFMILPVAAASMTGAAMSTVMGSPDMSKILGGLGADVMGFVLLFRLTFPPALTIAAIAPIFAAGITPDELNVARAQNLVGYAILVAAFSLMYIRYQKPARV